MGKKKFEPYEVYLQERAEGTIETIKSEVRFEQQLIDLDFTIIGYKFLQDTSVYSIEKEGISLEVRHTRINRKNSIDAQVKWILDCFEMKKKIIVREEVNN